MRHTICHQPVLDSCIDEVVLRSTTAFRDRETFRIGEECRRVEFIDEGLRLVGDEMRRVKGGECL